MDKTLTKGISFSFVSALSFATLAILIKIGYNNHLNTIQMLFFRFLFATIIMAFFFLITKPVILKPRPKLLLKAFLTGTVLYTAQAFCFFRGIKYVSPNVVELILYLYPATVTILSHFIFKERINGYKAFFIGIILLGFAFIFHDAFGYKVKLLGVGYATLAMLVYSVYLVCVQILVKNENPISFSFYTIFFAVLSFSAISLSNFVIPRNLYQVTIGILLGLIPTFSAIMFLFMAIEIIGSALTSLFSSVEPVFTIALAYLILHIGLNRFQLIGGILIIIGVTMANIYHAKRGTNA